jgi:hypothetical protein
MATTGVTRETTKEEKLKSVTRGTNMLKTASHTGTVNSIKMYVFSFSKLVFSSCSLHDAHPMLAAPF